MLGIELLRLVLCLTTKSFICVSFNENVKKHIGRTCKTMCSPTSVLLQTYV
jgi:hypothetical protein